MPIAKKPTPLRTNPRASGTLGPSPSFTHLISSKCMAFSPIARRVLLRRPFKESGPRVSSPGSTLPLAEFDEPELPIVNLKVGRMLEWRGPSLSQKLLLPEHDTTPRRLKVQRENNLIRDYLPFGRSSSRKDFTIIPRLYPVWRKSGGANFDLAGGKRRMEGVTKEVGWTSFSNFTSSLWHKFRRTPSR